MMVTVIMGILHMLSINQSVTRRIVLSCSLFVREHDVPLDIPYWYTIVAMINLQ